MNNLIVLFACWLGIWYCYCYNKNELCLYLGWFTTGLVVGNFVFNLL